jgi:hypothetical protein
MQISKITGVHSKSPQESHPCRFRPMIGLKLVSDALFEIIYFNDSNASKYDQFLCLCCVFGYSDGSSSQVSRQSGQNNQEEGMKKDKQEAEKEERVGR